MIVNNLPSKTWNFLRMNNSSLDIKDMPSSFIPKISNENENVSANICKETSPVYSMKTGMGEDMTSLVKDAEAVEIVSEKNSKDNKPVYLQYNYANGEKGMSRLLVHGKKNSVLQVVVELSSKVADEGLSALQTLIYAEEGAKVSLYVSNILGKSFLYLNDIGGKTEKDAEINLLKLELGGKSLYAGTEIDLEGSSSSFSSKIGYHTKEYQLLDMNYNAVHYGKKTETQMEIMGTLEDGAKKIFRGTIDFKKGSSGAVGGERENVLMLGEDVVNRSIPLILCSEEDVEGNHGASIGQLDEKVLFYLLSRGFSEEEAKLLMAKSRIKAICEEIPLEDVKNRVNEFETENM